MIAGRAAPDYNTNEFVDLSMRRRAQARLRAYRQLQSATLDRQFGAFA